MAKKSERKLLLFVMLFAFACLLLHGGGRLIASEEARPVSAIRAAICDAQVQRPQTGAVALKSAAARRMHAAPAPQIQASDHSVPSDANGNVIASKTYMRAVYQAFTLDDGFV